MLNRFIDCVYEEYKITDDYKLLSFTDTHISEISSFVAEVYYNKKHYKFDDDFDSIKDSIHEDDERLDQHSFIFCLLNKETDICCTLKLFKKDSPNWRLPIEEEFGIDLNYFEELSLLEVGRFASNGNISFNTIVSMFKMITQIVDLRKSRLFASLDKRVYKQLLRLKYPIYPLGNYKYYMGTDTIPVGVKVEELLLLKLGG